MLRPFRPVPWIIRNGEEKFAALGTAKSKGTKVFALAGKIRRGGLIEVPMGTTIREIVEEIGGGAAEGRRFKAVQIGGPSGGCVPARLADTPVDFESLREVGAIMGSGGLVVLDDTSCMVDMARYFLQFTQDQSCGKCTFCRIGTKRMLDILDRLCTGKATRQHLEELERLAVQVGAGSLCGLGKTAPNPVLSTLRYFRAEYEAHLAGRCPARKCTALVHYTINTDCTGCTICAQNCPVEAIPMTPYAQHIIDDAKLYVVRHLSAGVSPQRRGVEMSDKFTITVDGQPVEVQPGETVLTAARKLAVDIPTLCFLEKCGPLNTCQVCLVKLKLTRPLRAY